MIGHMVAPANAYFNHSCDPNCEVTAAPSCVATTALRGIRAGEEITIAYVDTPPHEAPLDAVADTARRSELKRLYFFDCCCARCKRL